MSTTTTVQAEQTTITRVVLPGPVEPGGLQLHTAAMPEPGPGEVRMSVEATGVSFAEQQMRKGKYYDQPPFPFVPGYDVVGTVTAVGEGVEAAALGHRYAAITKTGGWAGEIVLAADELIAVPDGIDPVEAETLVVNGLTAWQMLHRVARVQAGDTVLVLGANGGVGTTLVQLARIAGVRVIGTALPHHHDTIRALGAEPVDYRDPKMHARIRELAPGGVDAVFDHVGGPGIIASYRSLAPEGTLVSYGTASTKDVEGSSKLPVLTLIARLVWWNSLPNGHRATFFNVWSGLKKPDAFYARVRQDLGEVFALLRNGQLHAQVAARIPLTDVAEAVRLAESGTVTGKVVLVP